MKWIQWLVVAAAAATMLSACGGGNSVGEELGITKPSVRFIHAIPSGPNVDFFNNGVAAQSNAAYTSVSAYNMFSSGATTFSFNATGTTAALATAPTFNAANGHLYTTLAIVGTSALPAIAVIDDPFDKGLLNNQARVRAFNASFNANAVGPIDIYLVSASNTNIASATPQMANVAYDAAAPASGQDSIYLDGGSYVIVVTHAGSKTPIFTSSAVSLSNNADWLITTLPTGGLGTVTPDAIEVLVASTGGANGTVLTDTTAAAAATPASAVTP
ncbi:MAG: DUF4397 domain-containing protein [Pararobbsia sp.]